MLDAYCVEVMPLIVKKKYDITELHRPIVLLFE